jgi:predicted AAA+ superfamily ATPase
MYKRVLLDILKKAVKSKKVLLLFGARQVGKTTLVKELISAYPDSRYINCELLQNRAVLNTTNSEKLKFFLGNYKLIVLDEAQSLENIGLILKILYDELPDLQIVVTGSSAFELRNQTSEPLTGRSRQYRLYPLALSELTSKMDRIDVQAKLEQILRFGLYPAVFDLPEQEALEELNNITSNYLFKDILIFERIKNADILLNLLRALAMQLGSEVSFNELSRLLGISVHTVKRYIDLLEKTFVIFSLSSYSSNPRKEIAKGRKIYFYDLGVRNMIIQNFNPMSLRADAGALWENFCIAERIKVNEYKRRFLNTYFWRTFAKNEIDYLEEYGGNLYAYEFKYNPKAKSRVPKAFSARYPNADYKVISPDNYFEFIWI